MNIPSPSACLTGLACATLSLAAARGETEPAFRFITLAPGHFHAALVQKRMLPSVSPEVHIYAPDGPDLALHLARVEGFNKREQDPTAWKSQVHTGPDFLQRMLAEKPGNIVVLAGNNREKTRYILESVKAGLHVLADKPMAITPADFKLLQQAYQIAAEKKLMIYDIMTERHEITTQLQRFFAHQTEFFGTIDPGRPDDPSLTKESVHHFYKTVAGSPLQRPPWFYDATQQGEGIVDVTTHLVDLVQWGLFPEKPLGLNDAKVLRARTWTTKLTPAEFQRSTKIERFPDYLAPYQDAAGNIDVPFNGEFTFVLNGVHAKISVIWNYEAPAGGGDTHFSLLRGTKVSAIIRQGAEQGYKPMLYLEPRKGIDPASLEASLQKAVSAAAATWPGVAVERSAAGWTLIIPPKYYVGHEAHFGQVAEKFLGYLRGGEMPSWEIPNILAKYRTIMDAYTMSRK
jgi:predicted dehydrogenase